MSDSEYENRKEGATVRRLGRFGTPNLDSVKAAHPSNGVPGETPEDAPEPNPRRAQALLALLLLVVGCLIGALGITMIYGIGHGLTTLGASLFAVGFFMALTN